ncbi:hypothetical protein [Corallincola holothuriorum]|nr:hypothetical protein [Corallincola holothuriorum]
MDQISRRRFLLTMLGTGTVVAFGSVLYFDRDLVTRRHAELLDPYQETALRAFLPVILNGVISRQTDQRAEQMDHLIRQIELALKYLPEFSRDQFFELLSLLSRRLSRWALAGQWQQLDQLTMAQRMTLLQEWRHSFLDLLQQAYQGLREIVLAAWYGEPSHWSYLNYQKPSWVVPGR